MVYILNPDCTVKLKELYQAPEYLVIHCSEQFNY